MAKATLRIGEVAEKAGVSVSAIRFYEREGLLPAPERVSGQRRYDEATIQRLGTIDVAKQAGFSLEEVRILLTSVAQGTPAHEQLRALATRKLPEVEALIERAQAMRDWLTTASDCGCETLDGCGLFATTLDALQVSRHRVRAERKAPKSWAALAHRSPISSDTIPLRGMKGSKNGLF